MRQTGKASERARIATEAARAVSPAPGSVGGGAAAKPTVAAQSRRMALTRSGGASLETPRPSANYLATHSAILDATLSVIAEHSLSGTTVERVADAAGVAPGTVILHFKRKEALLYDALDRLGEGFEAARQQAIAGAGADPVLALERLVELMFDPAHSDPVKTAVWYAFWGESAARERYQARVGRYDERYLADIARLLGMLVARGGDRTVDLDAVVLGFVGLLEYLWQSILSEGRKFDRARARRLALAYLANHFPRDFARANED